MSSASRGPLLILLLLALSLPGWAQEALSSETILSLIEEPEARERAAEELQRLELHPLDLNRATAEELSRVPLLDPFFIRNLLLYRSQRGRIDSIYDLKEVQGVQLRSLELLMPYLTVDDPSERPQRREREHYVGSQYRDRSTSLLLRTTGSDGRTLDWALVGETDRGEPFRPIREGVMDFLSGSLRYRADRTTVILGDQRLTTGRGLVLGQGLSLFSSSIYGTGIPDLTLSRLRPHRSAREYAFLRGVGVEQKVGPVDLLLFAGYEPLDARISKGRILTLYNGGLHRDASAQRHRRTARREMAGGNLSLDGGGGHLGVTGLLYRHRSREGATLRPPERYPDRTTLLEGSIDGHWMGERLLAVGEVTLAGRDRQAAEGSVTYLDEETIGALTLSGRYYGEERYSPYGAADSYYSSGRDEWGCRLQWHGEVARFVEGTVLVDRFRRLSPERPPAGTMLLMRLSRSTYHGSTMLYARWLQVPDRPRRLTLRLSSDRPWGSRLTLRYSLRLHHTEGAGFGGEAMTRLRYDDGSRLLGEVGLQAHSLRQGQMARAVLPWMPYMYGAPMLRGRGLLLSGRLRWRIDRHLSLSGRLYHAITAGHTPTTDLSLALLYRL